jgi:hypothetical protein
MYTITIIIPVVYVDKLIATALVVRMPYELLEVLKS